MNRRAIDLCLDLFGAVLAGEEKPDDHARTVPYGIVIEASANYARKRILARLSSAKLDAKQLNATFHKSWKVIRDTSREELFIHQILHYLTTYGTDFTSDFVYFPAEELQLPDVGKLPIRVIRGLSHEELVEKCLEMLASGVALEEATIDAVLELLGVLNYQFTSVDHVLNKEARIKIIAQTGIYPSQPVEFLRYLVFRATESTLLIKNSDSITAIKEKKLDVSESLEKFGLAKCAEIFRRFKPLWLAFKANPKNVSRINEISRLSRRHHVPLPLDVLNTVTHIHHSETAIREALTRVNNFRKIRLLNALHTRRSGVDAYLYRIRDGRSWAKATRPSEANYYRDVFDLVYENLVDSLDLAGQRVRYPEGIDYALPSSQKMFVGNVPAGTRITSKNLVSGVYWENDWGANDLDLSALSLEGKVGWNSAYKGGGILYSGDITDAPEGATELLFTEGALAHPALSVLNIYDGKEGCRFKIIVGSAPQVTENYMFDPNQLILEADCKMVGRQQILGIFLPAAEGQLTFVLVNAGFGSMSVSSGSTHCDLARRALFLQFSETLSFRKLLEDAGAHIVREGEAEIDLRPGSLAKDTFVKLLHPNPIHST